MKRFVSWVIVLAVAELMLDAITFGIAMDDPHGFAWKWACGHLIVLAFLAFMWASNNLLTHDRGRW